MALALLLSTAFLAVPALAQKDTSTKPKLWEGSALANASLFFGNTQQQVFGTDGKLARVDSAFGISAEVQGVYGEASLANGPRAVVKRTWTGTVTANVNPLAMVSSYVTAVYQSSLEKRIAERYSLGAGAKWNVRHTSETHASLSAGLAFEHTTPLDSTVKFPESGIARVSVMAKFRHSFDGRVVLTHSTSYEPSASGPAQYVIDTNTQLRYKMNGIVSLSATFTDDYDSGAMARGARSNNGGEMLFGVAAGW